MTVTAPFRWGILSTGHVAESFVTDLFVDPKTRGVEDIIHQVVAVGSRSLKKAQEFINKVAKGNSSIAACGSYEEVYTHKDVDAVYIATPHAYHYNNALSSIKAGKHVLCEKPATRTAAELSSLLAAAKGQGVFFMEALWTRFQPLALEVKKIIDEGSLGLPVVLHADLSENFHLHEIPTTHRILDPNLGGGALLDLGPYPLVWAILAIYEHPLNKDSALSNVVGTMIKTPLTGVDSNTSFIVTFSSSKLRAHAILSCSINLHAQEQGVHIRFEHGTITIAPPIFCPKEFTVTFLRQDGQVSKVETKTFEYVGGGWHFQADEVASCVRDGKKESEIWSHANSLLQMKIFDEVRRQGGYVFPQGM